MQKLQLRLHQANKLLHAVQHGQKKDNQINTYTHILVYNSSYIPKTDAWSLKYLMCAVTQFQASLSKFQESFPVVIWIFSCWNGSPLQRAADQLLEDSHS